MTKKSFIKTIGSKGLLSDYNTEGKKLQTELTAGDNVTIANNVISSNQVFVATYGTTTYQEIKDAYDAGKICLCTRPEEYYKVFYLRFVTSSEISFTTGIIRGDSYNLATVNNKNTWVHDYRRLQSKLTFDTTPTAGSNNPVTSDGIAGFNGYKKLFTQGSSASTTSDSSILFYVKWKTANDSGIYNRQFEINYSNYRTGNSGRIRIAPNITNPTAGTLNLVSDRFNFNDLTFGVIEAPDGDATYPYWFVGYGYGVGGSIEIIQNGRVMTSTDRPVVIPSEQILTSSCTFTKVYTEKPKYYDYTLYPPTTGTYVLKAVDGAIKWVQE